MIEEPSSVTARRRRRRRRMPTWAISRGFVGPFGRLQFRPIGKVRAWTQDQAIERVARRLNCIAILQATREPNE